jgi:hypothetical protein
MNPCHANIHFCLFAQQACVFGIWGGWTNTKNLSTPSIFFIIVVDFFLLYLTVRLIKKIKKYYIFYYNLFYY